MRLSVLSVLLVLALVSSVFGQTFPNVVKGNMVVEGYVLPRYGSTFWLGSNLFHWKGCVVDSGWFSRMRSSIGYVDTLVIGWEIRKHRFGNAGADTIDTTVVSGLDSLCVAVGVGSRYSSSATTFWALQYGFARKDTFYVYRRSTDPDTIENFTIFRKK